ncbi:hypothetical protein D9619_003373 [Psilocybe cf. subviscida]|uniref:Protein kinase domain-containing protein n=1 Tax=Psilocybe cf. subviscida TaxID=2480587 RepID=A0A8H5EUP6_9AGAR|nr:hypothetical protein D9619_003373 [Psilocybe cf. subviscida]
MFGPTVWTLLISRSIPAIPTTMSTRPIPLGNIDKLEIFQHCVEGGNDHTIMPEDAQIRAMEHEIRMMETAGEDCAFQPLGKALLSRVVTRLDDPSFALPPTKVLVEDLASLVRRLHDRGVLHGDIKCSNLLYFHQTGGLLFCDFGSAHLSTSKGRAMSLTPQYSTPARAREPMSQCPLSKGGDLYAAGITLWEIAASAVDSAAFPFHDIDDIVMAGFQPNMYLVEDVSMRQLIRSFLEEGSPGPCPSSTRTVCITATIACADCASVFPHTYSKTVHREGCEGAENCDADLVYHAPSMLSHAENLHCDRCS